ncbi:MAG: hypothetical protein WKG06_10730 [Segetibacter sp.]
MFSNHISSSIPGNLKRCNRLHALLHGKAGFIRFMVYKGRRGCCPKCNMAKKKGCCEDKHKTVKIESKYSISQAIVSVSKPTVDPPHYHLPNLTLTSVSVIISYPLTNSPPGIGKTLLYISNCVYLI